VSPNRERLVTKAFVSLADSLVGPFDVVELLDSLTEECARLLDVASAGLLLADRFGVLHVVAASSEQTRSLEVFQLQRDEGPCLECYRTGAPVSVANLQSQAGRWPQFVTAAGGMGFASVHAVPMRLHDQMLGALGLFGTTAGSLTDEDLSLGQALAHVASVALVAGNVATDRESLNLQLQTALESRVLIEQAKGAIAQQADVNMDEAFTMLRRYSRDHNQKLTDVARAVATRSLPIQEVSDRRQPQSSRRTVR
jgi:transcriptional regulator with GAF, ATPase, and Fis domain